MRKSNYLGLIVIFFVLITLFGCTVENNKPSEMPVLVDKGPYSTYSRIIEMTIPGATGTIYYTIDGSDPTLNNSYIYSPSELKTNMVK